MSQKAATDFVGQLAIDASVREELAKVLADVDDRTQLLARTVRFAAQRGYDMTVEEIAPYCVPENASAELSDEELSKVAGGAGVQSVSIRVLSKPVGLDCSFMNAAGYNCY